MKAIIVFFIKVPEDAKESVLKNHRTMMEEVNKDLFKRLREEQIEFMYAPVPYEAGSHVDINYFNGPWGAEQV